MRPTLSISLRRCLPDRFEAGLRALAERSDCSLTITRQRWIGPARAAGDRLLAAGDDEAWADAQHDADAGLGTIETVRHGRSTLDAFVGNGPYRPFALAALERDGRLEFDYATDFVVAQLDWPGASAPLRLSLDASLCATGSVEAIDDDGSAVLAAHDWYEPASIDASADHRLAIELTDALAALGELQRDDSSGYLEHRDADELRRWLLDLRAACERLREQHVSRRLLDGLADAMGAAA
jgi:hypothetical protein